MKKLLFVFIPAALAAATAFAQTRPNVVLIYADDIGYGDVLQRDRAADAAH
jgi:DNA transposition AAA+ family ATPase